MYHTNYSNTIINLSRITEKIINQYSFNEINKQQLLSIFDIKSLEITLRIPSKSIYEHGFIAMLMLTEKLLNNKVIFLLDKNTLSKKRTIKIGTIITIKNEIMDNFLTLCCNHSIPKFYDEGIFFHIPYKDNPLSYKIKKILSNTLFSFDKDINSYYDYLGELEYDIDFLFRTYFKSILINKLMLSNKGIHFINSISLIQLITVQKAKEQSIVEEFEIEPSIEQNKLENELTNENELDDEIENIYENKFKDEFEDENINENKNNNINNNYFVDIFKNNNKKEN